MTTKKRQEATVSQIKDAHKSPTSVGAVKDDTALNLIPAADIHETKEGIVVYLDLPGVNVASLDISVDSHVLTVKGKLNLQMPTDLTPTYMDVPADAYRRQFTLSSELDNNKIKANLKEGVLKLEIPRSEKHKPRKIEVKAA